MEQILITETSIRLESSQMFPTHFPHAILAVTLISKVNQWYEERTILT